MAVAFFGPTYSQQFTETTSIELSDSLSVHDVEWVDVNNDSLLDVMLFARNAAGEDILLSFSNSSAGRLTHVGYLATQVIGAGHFLTDLDGDNQVDVVVSGAMQAQPSTSVFINKGNFRFQSQPISDLSAEVIRAADFDGDGFTELILSGRMNGIPFLRILKRGPSGWSTAHDSIKVYASAIEVFNFNSDTDVDFFVSGTDEHGTPVSRAYHNRGGLHFTAEDLVPGIRGTTTRSDLNDDGLFDIRISGEDVDGAPHLQTLFNHGEAFAVRDSITSIRHLHIFSADFDSDGIADLHTFGVSQNADTLNAISRHGTSDRLTHTNLLAQAFGDSDRDGDIDVVQLRIKDNNYSLAVLRNETARKNLPPKSPSNAIAAMIFNRLFLTWNRSGDDHTNVNSLTYDVSIQLPDENLMTAEFDQINGRRLLVTHGNNTTAPYVLIRRSGTGAFYYNIQAVDNAFHAGYSGICRGSGGDNACVEMKSESIDACKKEQLILEADSPADWFSFSDGFLGHGNELAFTVHSPDTLFSAESHGPGCANIVVYTIQTPTVVKKLTETTEYLCEGTHVTMGVEPHWAQIEWTSSQKGFLCADDSISFVLSIADTIKVTVSDEGGCEIQRNSVLLISKPDVNTSADTYQILQGHSVRFDVTGGLKYEWEPVSGLSDPYSSSPVASPSHTTQYMVTVQDSVGCTAKASILVIVEETAFIPNLFTPNSDGSNDILKIYGLETARDFSFTIYNREGNQVFHTKSISEAVQMGWDGTSSGVNQPVGIYYWHVRGETDGGESLQLNGKASGSIVLLR